VMRAGAGFNADKTPSLFRKERQDLTAPQLPARNSSTRRINSMDLEDILREIKSDLVIMPVAGAVHSIKSRLNRFARRTTRG
jgi:hypothetical protein